MYARIFTSLFDGSMRGHSDLILVFVNCLCHADKDGIIDRTCRAIADETGLSLRRVGAAITVLEGPDGQSRSRNDDGRRLKRIDPERSWGWEIVNFRKYDAIRNSQERREYMRNLMREKRKTPQNPNEKPVVSTLLAPVSNVSLLSASVSASVSAEDKNSSPEVMAFDVFWKQYPKKIGKGAARKAFEKWKCAGKIGAILKAIGQQAVTDQWRKEGGQFIPNPATWLNQERWSDEVLAKAPGVIDGHRKPTITEVMKLLTELRSQKETMWNRHSFNGEIPADKPTVRQEYTDLCRRVKELEKQARVI